MQETFRPRSVGLWRQCGPWQPPVGVKNLQPPRHILPPHPRPVPRRAPARVKCYLALGAVRGGMARSLQECGQQGPRLHGPAPAPETNSGPDVKAQRTEETEMKLMQLLIAMLFVALSATACNTIHGAGQDIERGGQEIQEASDEVSEEIDEEFDD